MTGKIPISRDELSGGGDVGLDGEEVWSTPFSTDIAARPHVEGTDGIL